MENALRQRDETTLTLTDAASESGYSADHLGRLVCEGKITNAGGPGAAPNRPQAHALARRAWNYVGRGSA